MTLARRQSTMTVLSGPVCRRIIRYAISLVSVGLASALTSMLWAYLDRSISTLFITAVMISAVFGGIGPGLLTGVLSALVCAFFFMPPRYSFEVGGDDALRLLVFVLIAMLISWISEASRRARETLESRVQERTRHLSETNLRMQEEVAERHRVEEENLAYQTRLQSLAVELVRTEERERRQIASTLHDAIGHTLAVVLMKLRGMTAGQSEAAVAAEIESACGLIETCIRQARSLTLELSPPVLYEFGLEAAVEWLAERFQREHGPTVQVCDDGRPKPLAEESRAMLFSAIRELLFNVAKHASARNLVVRLSRDCDMYEVVVEDDGIGFEGNMQASGASGFGLFSIRERISHLGGRFELDSAPGHGCRATVRLPLARVKPGPEDNP